jgi:hypothetical protein
MDDILSALIDGTTPSHPPSMICTALVQFQRSIGLSVCSAVPSDLLHFHFCRIWKVLFSCAASPATNVRLSTYTATSLFLHKIVPFFPAEVRDSFSAAAEEQTSQGGTSVLILAAFAFLSHCVGPHLLDQWLGMTPVFHHFKANEVLSSDHLATIVENIGDIGLEWFQNVLVELLQLHAATPGRLVAKAICAVIKRDSDRLLRFVLQNDPSLSLVAYIFHTMQFDLTGIDLLPLAKEAFDVIERFEDGKNVSELDEALGFLAIRSPSFRVIVASREDPHSFELELVGYKKTTFSSKDAFDRPAVYALPFSRAVLVPRDGDSTVVFTAKMLNIASAVSDENAITDLEDVISVFDEWASVEFNDRTSGVLQSLERCINSLIVNSKSFRLSRILRRVLFVKPSSWYQSFDILRVIRAMNVKLIPLVLGQSAVQDLLRIVVGFCVSANDDLSRSSFDVVAQMTTAETFYEITAFIANDTDFFDATSLRKHLLLLTRLMATDSKLKRDHLQNFREAVLEAFLFHSEDIWVLSSIYLFFSYWTPGPGDQHSLEAVLPSAWGVLGGALQILVGSEIHVPVDPDVTQRYGALVTHYFGVQVFEVVAKEAYNYRTTLLPIHMTLKFLLTLSPDLIDPKRGRAICTNMFRYFPRETTIYLSGVFLSTKQTTRDKTFGKIANQIQAVTDPQVLAAWCHTAIRIPLARGRELLPIALWYIANRDRISLRDFLVFSAYVDRFGDIQERGAVLQQILNVPKEKENELCDWISRHRGLFTKQVEDAVANIVGRRLSSGPDWTDFTRLSDVQKEELVNRVLSGELKEVTREISEFGDRVLTGWKRLAFRVNAGSQTDLPPVFPFNPLVPRNPLGMSFPDRLKYFVDMDLVDALRHVLRMASIQGITLDFTGLRFSHLTLPRVIRYLRKHNSPQALDVSQFLNAAHFRTSFKDAAIQAFAVRPADFISELCANEVTTKADLVCLSRALSTLPADADTSELSAFLLGRFSTIRARRNFASVLLRTITVFVRHFHVDSQEFHDRLSCLISENLSVFPESDLAISVAYCPSIAISSSLSRLPSLWPSETVRTGSCPFLASALVSVLPSDFCGALRILAVLASSNSREITEYLRTAFSLAGPRLPFPNVPLALSALIRSTLTDSLLRGCLIDSYLDKLLPAVSRAAYLPIAETLPLVIKAVAREDSASRLDRYVDSMVSQPSSFAVFRVYADCLRARIQNETRRDRARFIAGAARAFFAPGRIVDEFRIERYLAEWTALLRAFVSLEEALEIEGELFAGRANERFFPAFVALASVTKLVRARGVPEREAQVQAMLARAEGAVTDARNKQAIAALARGQSLREVLRDLAL